MPTDQSPASRDERLVSIPMWIIEAVRAEIRLEIDVWSEMARHVDESLARSEQALPCDVKLPAHPQADHTQPVRLIKSISVISATARFIHSVSRFMFLAPLITPNREMVC